MNLRSASEVCFGLAMKGAASGMFNPEHFVTPYDVALQDIDTMSPIELEAKYGRDAISAAKYAAEEKEVRIQLSGRGC